MEPPLRIVLADFLFFSDSFSLHLWHIWSWTSNANLVISTICMLKVKLVMLLANLLSYNSNSHSSTMWMQNLYAWIFLAYKNLKLIFLQLFGLGVANICGSFFSSYPSTGKIYCLCRNKFPELKFSHSVCTIYMKNATLTCFYWMTF